MCLTDKEREGKHKPNKRTLAIIIIIIIIIIMYYHTTQVALNTRIHTEHKTHSIETYI